MSPCTTAHNTGTFLLVFVGNFWLHGLACAHAGCYVVVSQFNLSVPKMFTDDSLNTGSDVGPGQCSNPEES